MIPVVLKGPNYLLWSRLVKTALGGKGLWVHCTQAAPKQTGGGLEDRKKWQQKDLLVLPILQSSLTDSLMETYLHCESAKELWETLYKVYGNSSNLSRVYELKKAINDLSQEEMEFSGHFGKFSSLWGELDSLRPSTTDQDILLERREQDKVFGLFLTLSPIYTDLIKHILRSEKLPTLEEVCSQVQKEHGSNGLFQGKESLLLANQAAASSQSYKDQYKKKEGRGLRCEHCKREGHTKEKCWDLHPHLKPSKFR